MNLKHGETVRVWFNRWFPGAFHAITLMKNNPDRQPVTVYGTHDDSAALMLLACDHREAEPDIASDAYVDFALDFCERNRIDVFVPRNHLNAVAHRGLEFEAAGVRLLVCGSGSTVDQLDDKAYVYGKVREWLPDLVPLHYVVTDEHEFASAYLTIRCTGSKVCIKPVMGEGGAGFRVVEPVLDPRRILALRPDEFATYSDVIEALRVPEPPDRFLVSQFIDGPDWSVDCLADAGELLAAVARKKLDLRSQAIEHAPALIRVAEEIASRFHLSSLFNVQFRESSDGPKLVEINPRMSAGVHIASLAGANLPYLALQLLVSGQVTVPEMRSGITVAWIEGVVHVDNGSPPHPRRLLSK